VKVVAAEQMRRIDRECIESGLPASVLMENAGKAVAVEVRRIMGDIGSKRVLVLSGPGNNGGDGLVAARYLHDWGAEVFLFLFGKREAEDPNLVLVRERGIACTEVSEEQDLGGLGEKLSLATAVVDALLGTGNARPLGGVFKQALEQVRKAGEERPSLHVFALDLPSGMNADTGAVDNATLSAHDTITLGLPKVGIYCPSALEYTGDITIVDIGIPPDMAEDVNIELIDSELAGRLLPRRPRGANKGTFGRVMVVAGSINYIGAAYLACSGAIRVGAGLVTLATAESLQPILASKLTEVTYLPLPESEPGFISPGAADILCRELDDYDVLLMGCGLGQSESVIEFVKSVLIERQISVPVMVLDADALNTLANVPEWWRRLTGNAILTPHPGELARLTGLSVEEVQADRLNIAGKCACEWGKTVVHKGGCTMVAMPDGRSAIYPVANPGLATAGTGDVLGGIIAGLAAQGLTAAGAAVCGVYLGGEAGKIVREKLGDTGMIASDLLPVLPLAIKKLREDWRENKAGV
jgi:hydroxyethylthiazole kinase-like uncharacterized protein yjeF